MRKIDYFFLLLLLLSFLNPFHVCAQAPLISLISPDPTNDVPVYTKPIIKSTNVAIAKEDGKDISFPTDNELIIFKKGNKDSDQDVPFSAAITGGRTEITVTPTSNLEPNTQYYIALKPVKKRGGADTEISSLTEFTFTTGPLVTVDKKVNQFACIGSEDFLTLQPIVIKEGAPGNFRKESSADKYQSFILELPDNFTFVNDKTDVVVSLSNENGDGVTGNDISLVNINAGDKYVHFYDDNPRRVKFWFNNNVTTISSSYKDVITISGLKVKATSAVTAGTVAQLTRSSATGGENDAYLVGIGPGSTVSFAEIHTATNPTVSLAVSTFRNSNCVNGRAAFEVTPSELINIEDLQIFINNIEVVKGVDSVEIRRSNDFISQGEKILIYHDAAVGAHSIYVKAKVGGSFCYGKSNTLNYTIIDSFTPIIKYGDVIMDAKTAIPNDLLDARLRAYNAAGVEIPGSFSGPIVAESQDGAFYLSPSKELGRSGIYPVSFTPIVQGQCALPVSYDIEVYQSASNILGLINGGACRSSEPINIGFTKQEPKLIELVSFSCSIPGVITGKLDEKYSGGTLSNFKLNPKAVKDLSVGIIDVTINYNKYNVKTAKMEPAKPLLQQVVISDSDSIAMTLSNGVEIKNSYCEGSPYVVLAGSPFGKENQKNFFIKDLSVKDSPLKPLVNKTIFFREKTNTEEDKDIPEENFLKANGGAGYELKYEYTNDYGCKSEITKIVYTYPLPPQVEVPIFHAGCVGEELSPVVFSAESHYDYVWYDDKGRVIDTVEVNAEGKVVFLPDVSTDVAKEFNFSIARLSKTFCLGPKQNVIISIGEIPKADFSVRDLCEGALASFEDLSLPKDGIDRDKVTGWHWDFGDPDSGSENISDIQHPTHKFSKPGTYTVSLTAISGNGCRNTVSKKVNVFSFVEIANGDTGYYEDFEGDAHGWIESGITQESTKSSWQLNTPSGNTIKGAASGSRAWITNGGKDASGKSTNTYNVKESSWLESPCFDLSVSVIKNPMVAFKFWSDSEKGFDGAVLQYKVAGKEEWKVLGALNEGLNWYNMANIISSPGGQTLTDGNLGWSYKDSTGWKEAKFMLDNVQEEAMGAPVRFRIAFSSNESNFPGTTFDGFAFDDFRIKSRKRVIVLEHFMEMAQQTDLHFKEDKELNKFAEFVKKEALVLRYLISHQNTIYETDYDFNIGILRGRAMHYGVNQMPRTVLDGKYNPWYKNEPFFTNSSNWGRKLFFEQALQEPKFLLNVKVSSAEERLQFDIDVKKLPIAEDLKSVLVHVMVVEEALDIDGRTYYNLVREAVPDMGGTYIKGPFYAAEEKDWNIKLSWLPPVYLRDKKLKVIAYVQDFAEVGETKEIYQATSIELDNALMADLPLTLGVREEFASEDVKLVPNPASDTYYIRFASPTAKEIEYKVYDQLGKVVEQGREGKGITELKLSAREYTAGMYLIYVRQGDKIISKRLIVN